MVTFKDMRMPILKESKNQHLEHVEDKILKDGQAGAISALHIIDTLANTLRGHSNKKISVTTKWDGSPAIVVGINPENGKFFVGTKSVFNKGTKKIAYTDADIDKHYPKPELAAKLKVALKHLPALNIKGILQGDLLFTNDLKTKKIDGEQMITFQPNTIVYAIPATSDLADEISRAKIGVVFHTRYKGSSMDDLSASYNVSVEDLSSTEDVWFNDATYSDESGTATLTQNEYDAIQKDIKIADNTLDELKDVDELIKNNNLISMLRMYINSQIRTGQMSSNFIKEFAAFINDRIDKERTSEPTKAKKRETYASQIEQHNHTLTALLKFQQHITNAKLLLISKLNEVKAIGTFLQDGEGFRVTSPEGFVAIDHLGSAVKLVDRLEFSRANFNRYGR